MTKTYLRVSERAALSIIALTAFVLFASSVQFAAAATQWVNDDVAVSANSSCADPGFSTIASAITAASAGDIIQICPGTYTEEVTVDKALTLRGDPGDASAGPDAGAPILDGGDVVGSAITIDGGVSDVIIEGLIIKNYAPHVSSGGIGSGVLAWDAVSIDNVTVRDNHFENLGWSAVLVGNEGQSLHSGWTVTNNTAQDVGTYVIELTNTVSSTVSDNEVTGGTAYGRATQIGIISQAQVHTGAGVEVTGVSIEGNTVDGTLSRSGILLLAWDSTNSLTAEVKSVGVTDNEVSGAMRGLESLSFGTNALVTNITITGNTFSGNDIGLHNRNFGDNSVLGVSSNIICDNVLDVHIDGGTGNGLFNNQFDTFTDDGTGTIVSGNTPCVEPPSPTPIVINSSSIRINVTNRGTIDNDTSAKSWTGNNTAEGSEGGDGDTGGNVENSGGDNNNGGAAAGDGGDGGNGGLGGFVSTGNATSDAGTINELNTTDVELGIFADMNSSEVRVKVDNGDCDCNTITNNTKARARTGDNTAKGSEGGDGDPGGDVKNNGTGNFNNGGATAGDGGTGGNADEGGTVLTGNADSTSGTLNLLNWTRIRVGWPL